MGYELDRLKAQYGVSTPSMAAYSGATNPGAAPAAVTAVVKPADLRASPVAPVKPTNPGIRATPAQKAAYQAALATYNTNKSAYDADLSKWKTEKSAYDTSLKTYTNALPKYEADVAAYEKAKAAFEEQKAKYDVDRTAYDQYTGEYKNSMANTDMYNRGQFSTTGANVPAFAAYQPPPPPPQVNPTGLGQSVAPPQPNPMNMGTSYGQPQWSNTLAAPQYSNAGSSVAPVANVNTGTAGATSGGLPNTHGALGIFSDLAAAFRDGSKPSQQQILDFVRQHMGLLGGFRQNRAEGGPGNDGPAEPTGGYGYGQTGSGGGGADSGQAANRGGYTSVRDMFDGGGPGAQGGSFQGGGALSSVANAITGRAKGGQIRHYAGGGQVRGFAGGGADGIPVDERMQAPDGNSVQSLVEKYYPSEGDYAGDVKSARAKADAESVAFMDLMKGYMQNPESARSSKAEMYFRLASAFGSPTKTGAFGENLALANTELADYAKGQRATAAEQLQLQMEMQKMKMQGAKEDLAAARDLATTDMSNRRAIASKLIDEFIASGKPQSDAEKYALGLGLIRGTPEFTAKVSELTQLQIDKMASDLAAQTTRAADPASSFGKTAMDMGYKPGTLEFETEVKRLAELEAARVAATTAASTAATEAATTKLGQMTAPEVALRTETENKLSSLDTALGAVSEAYSLNPKSFPGGWMGQAQRLAFESLDPSDERVIATSRINSLLQEQALNQLKTVFGGNPTEGERAILLEIQGIGAKSLEERAQIMKRTYEVLQNRKAAEAKRLEDIKSGAYRTYETPEVAP